jgi:hypothetical protein
MGQARLKKMAGQIGNQTGSDVRQVGTRDDSPPHANRGEKENEPAARESIQTGPDRSRVNVSLPPGVHRALVAAAGALDTSVSSVAAMAILAGMASLSEHVGAVLDLDK